MPTNNLIFENYDAYEDIEDHRWRVNTTGMSDGVNANLVIDEAAKAEGDHRNGRWLLSGCPVTFDEATKTVKLYTKGGEEKIYGVLFTSHKIMNESGEFYDTIPVAVQRRGEIIHKWLPVDIDPADLPPTLLNTIL